MLGFLGVLTDEYLLLFTSLEYGEVCADLGIWKGATRKVDECAYAAARFPNRFLGLKRMLVPEKCGCHDNHRRAIVAEAGASPCRQSMAHISTETVTQVGEHWCAANH